jgi:hypothetical protein
MAICIHGGSIQFCARCQYEEGRREGYAACQADVLESLRDAISVAVATGDEEGWMALALRRVLESMERDEHVGVAGGKR